jgi:methyltransferase
MKPLYLILALVGLQRLWELVIADRNTTRLKLQGGIERGARHYPLFILLHGSWLLAVLLFTPSFRKPDPALLSLYFVLQLARLWVITSLGQFWTTRIIILPVHPLIRSGPYRYVSHPNYIIVVGEIALLPLAFGNVEVALVWSVGNALLLALRIHIENAALAGSRDLQSRGRGHRKTC